MRKQSESAEELQHEAALIRIWIRDVTAEKQARLGEIKARLSVISRENVRKR